MQVKQKLMNKTPSTVDMVFIPRSDEVGRREDKWKGKSHGHHPDTVHKYLSLLMKCNRKVSVCDLVDGLDLAIDNHILVAS